MDELDSTFLNGMGIRKERIMGFDSFEYKGKWWLPEESASDVEGTLRFSAREGAFLELSGSFKEPQDLEADFETDLIYGVTDTGKEVTLFKCRETRFQFSLRSYARSTILAHYVFVGALFDKTDDVCFNNIFAGFEYFDYWLRKSGISIEKQALENTIVVTYKQPEDIYCTTFKNYRIIIHFRHISPFPRGAPVEVTIKQIAGFLISTPEPSDIKGYISVVHMLRSFLAFACQAPIAPTFLRGVTEANKIERPEYPVLYPAVSVYYRLGYFAGVSNPPPVKDILLPYTRISGNFPKILSSWLNNYESFQSVLNLYFSTVHDEEITGERLLLSLTQALEAYHRLRFSGIYQDKNEYRGNLYRVFIESIPEYVEKDYRNRIESGFKYLFEFSLRQRLKEITGRYELSVSKVVEDVSAFIGAVIDTRNYLTHYDEDEKYNAKTGVELYYLNERLKFILEVCLLSELGFSDDRIADLLGENRRYTELKAN